MVNAYSTNGWFGFTVGRFIAKIGSSGGNIVPDVMIKIT
jgi:hypothetical protein